jgi:flavin-dependent dehydrogenase
MTDPSRFDVVILGGGLAGLTLALHLTQERPGTSILVIEKKQHPVAEAAHKVGESSVEVGAGYFTDFLGLLPHFEQDQLPKLGLRYFFESGDKRDLATRVELGGNVFFPTRSFQIDRGRFENFLAQQAVSRGVHFANPASVTAVEFGTGSADHRIAFRKGAIEASATARWVVDASGRAGIIKRKLALAKPCGHKANAVWWRYDRHIKIDAWSKDAAWQAQNDNLGKRWLSTVHFMGEGYWVWFIPLSSGSHSVGIVADSNLHPFDQMSSYEKAMEWLKRHEPQCAERLDGREGEVQDFLGLRDYSYSCRQVYSADRWALTGEAGAFLDPFYSPGSDYIGMGNTFIVDLIKRDLSGSGIATYASLFDRLYFTFFENHLTLYENQMPLFGDAKVMALKIIWDFAYYWAIPATFFFHRRLTDLMAFGEAREPLDRSSALNGALQKLFREWHKSSGEIAATFIDIPGIPFMHALNCGLQDRLDSTQFRDRLHANLALLDQLAVEILAFARQDDPTLSFAGFEKLAGQGPSLLSGVLPKLSRVKGKPSAEAHAGTT